MGWSSVYVIAGSHGLAKVGVSRDPTARLATLQTGSGHHLHLAYAAAVHGDAFAAEADAHALLARYRQAGEWFAVPVDVAVAAVSASVYRHSRPTSSAGERRPRWWLRYAAITALFAPVWTFSTPIAFVAATVSLLMWSSLRLIRRRQPITMRAALKWIAMTASAVLTSMLLAMPFIVAPAKADAAIPQYDANVYCKDSLAALTAEPNDFLFKACTDNEESMLRKLRNVWPEAPLDLKTQCLRQVKLTAHSYLFLMGCLSVGVGNMWMDGKLKLSRP